MTDRRTVTMTHIARLVPGPGTSEILRMLDTSRDVKVTASIVIPWIRQNASLPIPQRVEQRLYPDMGTSVLVPHEDDPKKQYRLFWARTRANLYILPRPVAEVTPEMTDVLDASLAYWQRNGIDDPVVAFEAWTGTAQTHVAMIRAAFPEQTADMRDLELLGLVFDHPTTD